MIKGLLLVFTAVGFVVPNVFFGLFVTEKGFEQLPVEYSR